MLFPIEQRFKPLEALIQAASERDIDEQIASYLCRLGSVQICGNLERCIEIIITTRLGDKSPPQVGNFLRRHFERGTNYDCERICQLLYRFDGNWGRSFKDFLDANEAITESISSCYAIRNAIAHGGPQSLGVKTLKQYYDASFEVIAQVELSVR